MTNMDYCKFQNTLNDLHQCKEGLDNGDLDSEDKSEEELRAAARLIRLCAKVAEDYGYAANLSVDVNEYGAAS